MRPRQDAQQPEPTPRQPGGLAWLMEAPPQEGALRALPPQPEVPLQEPES